MKKLGRYFFNQEDKNAGLYSVFFLKAHPLPRLEQNSFQIWLYGLGCKSNSLQQYHTCGNTSPRRLLGLKLGPGSNSPKQYHTCGFMNLDTGNQLIFLSMDHPWWRSSFAMANLTEWWWAGKVNCLDRNQVCKGGFISQCSLGGGIGMYL